MSKVALPELIVDVPNERWLHEAIAYAKSRQITRFGVPAMSKITAYWRGPSQVLVDMDLLAKLPGQRNEQNAVRVESLRWLIVELNANGLSNTGAPYIEVAYDGSAWVSEGNHRIMAAKRLGWRAMPVEIRYFDGAERVSEGLLSPDRIVQFMAEQTASV